MIGIRDIHIVADRPELKLDEITTYKNSPSTIYLHGVPKAIGKWNITSVWANVQNPNNTTANCNAVKVGSIWVLTLTAPTTSGSVLNGIVFYASGTDEDGNQVNNYVLGRADYYVYNLDRTIDATTTSDLYAKLADLEARVEALEG